MKYVKIEIEEYKTLLRAFGEYQMLLSIMQQNEKVIEEKPKIKKMGFVYENKEELNGHNGFINRR